MSPMSDSNLGINLEPGANGRLDIAVDDSMMSRHFGPRPVFTLARLVGYLEQAALQSVDERLPVGSTTVGYEVAVSLSEPVQPGMDLVIETVLTGVIGNHLRFDLSCSAGGKVIGHGTHKRSVVSRKA
jgi:fluoroacetyl-CoA thioesterase